MTTYPFHIEVEPDEDAWHAYCPALEKHGAATWGETRDEALENIRQVIEMVVTDLAETGLRSR
jgi:predicted RNase H-like HicB family nuclease